MLEIAFWIGNEVGVADSTIRARYADRSHTAATDRWIVFHLHLPLDTTTFRHQGSTWYVAINTMDVYHSQGVRRPVVVTRGRVPDYRAEYRLSRTYARGTSNTGALQDYNSRTETIGCRSSPGRWFIGYDRTSVINGLTAEQRSVANYALNLETLVNFYSSGLLRFVFDSTDTDERLTAGCLAYRTGRVH